MSLLATIVNASPNLVQLFALVAVIAAFTAGLLSLLRNAIAMGLVAVALGFVALAVMFST